MVEMRIAQILIKAGADVGAAGAEIRSRTAINGAAERGRLDMVKMLLDLYKLKDGESISGLCEEAYHPCEEAISLGSGGIAGTLSVGTWIKSLGLSEGFLSDPGMTSYGFSANA
ncbi:hypothetical protein LTR84_001313 [Exophiala bonariae]|uniref:Uncharacterized protein n=1 Tax=Exophiala bonariae TaxID=1690606 RepID=A0AAV9NFT1_9EURO|nr:hypothetical protein LTR84_001313 [Exophiala bonariae]